MTDRDEPPVSASTLSAPRFEHLAMAGRGCCPSFGLTLFPLISTTVLERSPIIPRITIEVPEGLDERLDEVKAHLSEEAARWRTQSSVIPAEVHRYILEFLVKNPSPQEIVDFKLTSATQERIRELLEKNRTKELTAEESAELDGYERLNRFVRKFKLQAMKDLQATS